jgi:esterase
MTLAFTEIGEGEPIVILHGLFGSGRNWASIAKALSDTYRVLTVDLPNHGASEWTEHVTYQGLAEATANFLTQHELQGCTLLGHSMGGKTAMTLALSQGDLINRLIVADIAPVPYDHDNLAVIEALAAVDIANVKSRNEAEAQMAVHISDRMLRAFLLQNLRREGDGYQWRINLEGLKASLPDLHGFPEFDTTFEKPAIFIAGAESDFVEPEHHAEIDRLFPNSSVVDLTHAGHWLHADNPKAFIQAVVQFLNA